MDSEPKRSNDTLRTQREERGWSQRRLADEIGTSEDTISRWERGERKPSPYYQEKLCNIFGKNARELGFIDSALQKPALNHEAWMMPDQRKTLIGYLRQQQEQILNALAPGSTNLRVGDVIGRNGLFISPPWELWHGTTERTSLVDYIIETLTTHQRVLLLGDAGQGKTTFLKQVFTLISDRFINDTDNKTPVPLYIPLRQFPSLTGNAFDLLWAHIADEFPLPFDNFTSLVRNNQIVFLFDGFDEINGELTQRAINERATSKIFARPSILTCRKSFFEFYLSMSPLREYYPYWIELQPLTLNRPVIRYITTFCERRQKTMSQKDIIQPEKIIEFIRSNQKLQDLAQRPFLLIMMLDIFTEPKEMDETEWNTTKLYRKYTEKWLKNEASKQDSLLKWHEKAMLLRELAWFMYSTKSAARSLYRLNQDTIFTLNELMSFVQTVASRYPHISEAQLLDDLCFRTLLAVSEGETFFFLHKSFQEYYVAKYIFERLCDKEQSTDIVNIVSSVLQEILPFEIVTFLKEMLSSEELTIKERNHVIDNLIQVYQNNTGDDLRSITIRQHASHYLACVGTQRAMQFLEAAYEQEPNKWVQRGIMVGLALYCDRADILERYITILREDPEASSINIGYHLVYYGDQAQELGYYDNGGKQIEGTVQALFQRLKNERYQNRWLLDLFTISTLLEQRGIAALQPYKQQLPFLRKLLSRDDQQQSPLFQQEKKRLENILQETKTWT